MASFSHLSIPSVLRHILRYGSRLDAEGCPGTFTCPKLACRQTDMGQNITFWIESRLAYINRRDFRRLFQTKLNDSPILMKTRWWQVTYRGGRSSSGRRTAKSATSVCRTSSPHRTNCSRASNRRSRCRALCRASVPSAPTIKFAIISTTSATEASTHQSLVSASSSSFLCPCPHRVGATS